MKVKFTKVVDASESPENGFDPENERHVNNRKVDIRMAAESIVQSIIKIQGIGHFRDPYTEVPDRACIIVEGDTKFTSGAVIRSSNIQKYLVEWFVCHLTMMMTEMDETGKCTGTIEVSLNDDDFVVGYEVSARFSVLKHERVARLSVLSMTCDYDSSEDDKPDDWLSIR